MILTEPLQPRHIGGLIQRECLRDAAEGTKVRRQPAGRHQGVRVPLPEQDALRRENLLVQPQHLLELGLIPEDVRDVEAEMEELATQRHRIDIRDRRLAVLAGPLGLHQQCLPRRRDRVAETQTLWEVTAAPQVADAIDQELALSLIHI